MTPVFKASASELVLTTQESAANTTTNYVIVRGSFQGYLELTDFRHGLLLTAMTSNIILPLLIS